MLFIDFTYKNFLFITFVIFTNGILSEFIFKSTATAAGSAVSKSLIDFLIVLYCIIFILNRRIKIDLVTSLSLIFLFICTISSFINNESIFSGFLYSRHVLYGSIFYLSGRYFAANGNVKFRPIFKVIGILLTIQPLYSIMLSFVFEQRVEWRVGTISTYGGTLAATISIFGMAYLLAYYYAFNRKTYLIIVSLLMLFVGYASGKRSVYFTFPIFFIIYYIVAQKFSIKWRWFLVNANVNMRMLILFVIFSPILVYGITNSHFLSERWTNHQGLYNNIISMIDAADEASYSQDHNGFSQGRLLSTTIVLHSFLGTDREKIFFGWGPESLTSKSENYIKGGGFEPLSISYGIVGVSNNLISVGILGTLAYLGVLVSLFYSSIFRSSQAVDTTSLFIKFFITCIFFVWFYTHFFYSSDFLVHDSLLLIVFFFAGILRGKIESFNY